MAVIVPIHQKMTNCAVTTIYRGISILLHCELFATVIMQRIRNRTEELIKEARAGFRPNRSTIDHRDVYRSCMVEFGKTLYACYVDFQKAFDSVRRLGLCRVMRFLGYDDEIARLLESLYEGTMSVVRID